MHFKQFFFSAISSLPSSLLIRESFPFQGDWGCFQHLHFAFYTLSTLLSELRLCLLAWPLLPFPRGPEWPAEMVRSDPGGEGKGHGILTTGGWPMPDSKPAGLWQEDRRDCLLASSSPLLIGFYEYLMKSRWNSIRSFTCCIFGRKKKKKWQDIIRFLWPQGRGSVPWNPSDSQVPSNVYCPHASAKSRETSPFHWWEEAVFCAPGRHTGFVWR